MSFEDIDKFDICLVPVIKTDMIDKKSETLISRNIDKVSQSILQNDVTSWNVQSKVLSGAGTYGFVEKVTYAKTGKTYVLAVKTCRCRSDTKKEYELRKLFSPDLVSEGLVTMFKIIDGSKFVMRFYENTLRKFRELHYDTFVNFAPDIMLQILTGIRKIHKAGIAHGDIHDNNILINCDKASVEAVISDYGSAVDHACEKYEYCKFHHEFRDIAGLVYYDSITPKFNAIINNIVYHVNLDQHDAQIEIIRKFVDDAENYREPLRLFKKVKVKTKEIDEIVLEEGIVIDIKRYKAYVIFPKVSLLNNWYYYEDEPFVHT